MLLSTNIDQHGDTCLNIPRKCSHRSDNPHILLGHLRAAVYEKPLTAADERILVIMPVPSGNSWKRRGGGGGQGAGYWKGQGFPAAQVSLKNISENTFTIIDESAGNRSIGTMEEQSAWQQLYEQAIYLRRTYFVRELNLEERIAYVRKIDADYYTQAITEIQIRVTEREEEKPWRKARAFFGSAEVMVKPYLFRKIQFGGKDSLGFGSINLPPNTMETNAFWLCPPLAALRRVRDFGRDPIEGLLGIANVLTEVLPLFVAADPADGSVVDQANDVPAVFV